MRRLRAVLSCLVLVGTLASCRSPVPIWNEDGTSITDLRTKRRWSGKSVELTPGVRLYADEIRYTDKHKRTGEAVGRVFLDVDPAARFEWIVRHGYAGRAVFDKKQRYVMLADYPMLEREFMTQIATEPYTTMDVRWDWRMADVIVRGPTRTDFAKAHPIPPWVVRSAVPVRVPRKPAEQRLPSSVVWKR